MAHSTPPTGRDCIQKLIISGYTREHLNQIGYRNLSMPNIIICWILEYLISLQKYVLFTKKKFYHSSSAFTYLFQRLKIWDIALGPDYALEFDYSRTKIKLYLAKNVFEYYHDDSLIESGLSIKRSDGKQWLHQQSLSESLASYRYIQFEISIGRGTSCECDVYNEPFIHIQILNDNKPTEQTPNSFDDEDEGNNDYDKTGRIFLNVMSKVYDNDTNVTIKGVWDVCREVQIAKGDTCCSVANGDRGYSSVYE